LASYEFARALLMRGRSVGLPAAKEGRVLLATTMAETFGVATQPMEVRLNILKT
jgi:hypothetical protein